MKALFWLSFAGVFYTYIGYALVIWVWSKLRPKPWKSAPIEPSISIVMAVRDGMALLPARLEQLAQLDYPKINDIVIVSDGSADGTEEYLLACASRRLIPVLLKQHVGKAAAVNAGIVKATGDIIVFLDVRPEVAEGAIQQLVSNFADESVGCAAGDYIIRSSGEVDGSAGVGRAYWAYEQWLRLCEAEIDSPVGVPGCFYAVRRQLVTPQPAGIILDDMFQPLSVIRKGYRSVVDVRARVYDSLPKRVHGEFRRKVRTLAGNFQLFRLAPWTLTFENRVLFQLVSHKAMRLVVPYLLLVLLVSSLILAPGSNFYLWMALPQVIVWLLALTAQYVRIPVLHRIAAPANALLVLNAAAVVGLYTFLFTRGPLWKTWSTTKATDMAIRAEKYTAAPR